MSAVSIAMRPRSTQASSRRKDIALSVVQPKTLVPKTTGGTDNPDRPSARICMANVPP